MNVHVFYVLEHTTSKFRLSGCLAGHTWILDVNTITITKELADPNKIWCVTSMYEM